MPPYLFGAAGSGALGGGTYCCVPSTLLKFGAGILAF
jgi:hypothetical protein